ncbi:MAG: hypothetical protein JW974_00460 [Alphaproteobacteria bacterium]|nr:hypothetical protein [Alphaproteobacteria bacterium]MBN2675221.1 hypothetical protein [Alphaproteobacteria bacterium]
MKEKETKTLSEKKSTAIARKEYLCAIADKIQSLVTNEKFIPSDIMVLVQRRNPFAGPLVKELKSRGIDVAGNDRIILPEFPAIRDLLNLIRFCIDPSDDFALCCTLKSPFYRLNERNIFDICSYRKELAKNTLNDAKTVTVFDVLQKNNPDIFAKLSEIIQWSKTLAPYSFFMRVLNTNNNRENMIAALGTQIIDPLEEFLTICLAYERTQPGTLKHFIKWFITGGSEIKRDMDSSSGVRIVTVHGSKGLEAPIVFLIDTITTPKSEKVFMIESDIHNTNRENLKAWLWAPQKNTSEKLDIAADIVMNKKIAEYYRLLYVAMTRARDRLYIYGFTANKNSPEIAWYTQLTKILSEISDDKTIRIVNDQ